MDSVVKKVVKLSHKQFRAMLKKFRRKRKRQILAKERERVESLEQQVRQNSPGFNEREEDRRRNSELFDQFEERERARKHKRWLLREQQAQIEFKKKQELLEIEKAKREVERKRILAEFEKQQFLESKVEEENQKIKSQKEEALQQALSNLPESEGPWHNPIAPQNFASGKEVERPQCQFFVKTGCCRFGESCSRGHVYPSVSSTILVRGMYTHFSIAQAGRDDFDTDNSLEYEEKERYQDFKNFYFDVLPEFRKFGKVMQFKVCSNYEPHLRGNVYVQFSNNDEAMEAYKNFNGRYYAGKQITCEFTNVIKWRSAMCGLYFRKLCPKGINCNFLHVFENPTNEFWEADRDISIRENISSSRSFRSNHSRSDRKSSYRDYSSESWHHRRDKDEYKNDYYYSGSYRQGSSSDSNSSDDDSYSRHKSSEKKYGNGSSRRSKHKRRYRDSRSRSRSRSPSVSESANKHHKRNKHKKKKKSKKKRRDDSKTSSPD